MNALLGVSTSNPMLTQITDRIPPLPILIPVLLTAWAAACTWLHGPAILVYIVLQGATSGIFALSMYKVSRRRTDDDGQSVDQATTDCESSFSKSGDKQVTS